MAAPSRVLSLFLGLLPFASLHGGDEISELAHGSFAHIVCHVDGNIVGSRAFQVAKEGILIFFGLVDLLVQKLVADRLSGSLTLHDGIVVSSGFGNLRFGIRIQ